MFQPSTYSGTYSGTPNLAKLAQDLATSVQQGKDTPTFELKSPGINIQFGNKPTPWGWYAAGGVAVLGVVGVGLWATGKIKF